MDKSRIPNCIIFRKVYMEYEGAELGTELDFRHILSQVPVQKSQARTSFVT